MFNDIDDGPNQHSKREEVYMSDSKQKFDDAISVLAKIFKAKNDQYGDSAFETGTTGSPFKWWMRFSDVSRKFTRLESLTQLASGPTRSNHEKMMRDAAKLKLVDDYRDLAIYAIIAMIVLGEDIAKGEDE